VAGESSGLAAAVVLLFILDVVAAFALQGVPLI
jgi:hypothetical protein